MKPITEKKTPNLRLLFDQSPEFQTLLNERKKRYRELMNYAPTSTAVSRTSILALRSITKSEVEKLIQAYNNFNCHSEKPPERIVTNVELDRHYRALLDVIRSKLILEHDILLSASDIIHLAIFHLNELDDEDFKSLASIARDPKSTLPIE